MGFILVSAQAEQDLESINDSINAYANPQSANNFLDKIADKFELLAQFPNLGRKRDELLTGLRSFPVEDYLIFYFAVDGGIEIARVASGYRDLDTLFRE